MTDAPRSPDSPENPHAGFGSVMLDIGGDVGALVVRMPESLVGEEVEIEADVPGEPEASTEHAQAGVDDHSHDDEGGHDEGRGHNHGHGHGHGHRPHVAVIRRPAGNDLIPSLVFPDLVEGRYRLMHKGTDDVVLVVEVRGGEVTESTWPD